MKAKARRPANFTITAPASVEGMGPTTWKVVVGPKGLVARRSSDGRRVSIGWRELLGTMCFYGKDSK